jgi:hypothetical protein
VVVAAAAAALAFLALAAPALAEGETVTVARLCYVVRAGDQPARAERPSASAQVVHAPAGLDRYAVCVDPPEHARPALPLEALSWRLPVAFDREGPEHGVALVQCGRDGATAVSGDVKLSDVVASCDGKLGASLGPADSFAGGGRSPGLGGVPWTPGASSTCGGAGGTDPRLAEDGGTSGGITVELDEDGITIEPAGGVTVELDADGITIESAGGVTVELDADGITIQPSGSSERPVEDAGASACEAIEELIWECGQSGWTRSDCQALDLLMRCGIDVTIVNPTDEGFACPKDAADADAVATAGPTILLHLCGAQVAHPLQGEDPCGSAGGTVLSGSTGGPGTCDPTIAETDGLGCPATGPDTTVDSGPSLCPVTGPELGLPCTSGPPVPTGPGPERR